MCFQGCVAKKATNFPGVHPYNHVPARITFGERIRKIFIFISLNLMYLALQVIVFWWKQVPFVLYLSKNTFLIGFTICFYDRNKFLVICRKCKIFTWQQLIHSLSKLSNNIIDNFDDTAWVLGARNFCDISVDFWGANVSMKIWKAFLFQVILQQSRFQLYERK